MGNVITVSKVNIIGWGGGPGMTYGITYSGEFDCNMTDFDMLRFVATSNGTRYVSGTTETVRTGYVFYAAPNTIREMVELV